MRLDLNAPKKNSKTSNFAAQIDNISMSTFTTLLIIVRTYSSFLRMQPKHPIFIKICLIPSSLAIFTRKHFKQKVQLVQHTIYFSF